MKMRKLEICILILVNYTPSSYSLDDASDIVFTGQLNDTERKWHDRLVEVLFGKYIVEEFSFQKHDHMGYLEVECSSSHAKIMPSVDKCANAYFRLLFSCLYDSPKYQIQKLCGCNMDCVYNNSCCFDQLFLLQPAPPKLYLERFLALTESHSEKRCLPFLRSDNGLEQKNIRNENYITTDRVFMVTTCRESSDMEDKRGQKQCLQNDAIQSPVFAPENGHIYKNKHCAECNGFKVYHRINATAEGCSRKCSITSLTTDSTRFDVTDRQYRIQKGQADIIHKAVCKTESFRHNVYSLGTETVYYCDKQEYALCKSYQAGVVHEYKYYANPHCVKCLKDSIKFSYVTELSPPSWNIKVEQYSYNITYANDRVIYGKLDVEKGVPSCSTLSVIPLPNTPTFEPDKKRHINKMFINCIFENHGSLLFKTKHKHLVDITIQNLENHLEAISGMKVDLKRHSSTKYFDVESSASISGAVGLLIAEASQNDDLWRDVDELLLTSLKSLQPSLMYGSALEHMFFDENICIDPITLGSTDANRVDVSDECNIKRFYSKYQNLPSYIEKDNTIIWIEMTRTTLTYRVSMCKSFHPKCSAEVFYPGHFKIGFNKSVEVMRSNGFIDVFTSDEYQPISKGIAVCTKIGHQKVILSTASRLTEGWNFNIGVIVATIILKMFDSLKFQFI